MAQSAPGASGAEAADAETEQAVMEDDLDAPPLPQSTGTADDHVAPPTNRDPILLKTVPTEYPKEFAGSGLNAEVVVTLLVDRLGRASHVRVEGSPDPAFTASALEALGQFEFLPALKGGKITNAPLRLTLQVNEDLGDRTLVDYEGGRIELMATSVAAKVETPARRLFGPRPAYPIEMLAAAKSGEVIVEFHISEDGRPRGLRIVEATFIEFSHAVQGAIALWKFSPAQNRGRPITSGLRYRISFQADEIPESTRAMAKRLLAGDHSDIVAAREIDRQPQVTSQIEPMAPPRESAAERTRVRRANVVFLVDEKGVVRLPRVLTASDPVSGYTALAAVNYWSFEPAQRKKQPVPVLVTMPFRF